MLSRVQAALIALLVISAVSFLVYQDFKAQKQLHEEELSMIKFEFETIPIEGFDMVVDVKIQRYSDATYLDLSLSASNTGSHDTILRNPLIVFYLVDVMVLERNIEDLDLPAGGSKTIRLNGLSFTTDKINEALKGGTQLSGSIDFSAVFSSEYSFAIHDIVLKTYRLHATFGGKVLLREIFGGKTKSDAAEDILGLN